SGALCGPGPAGTGADGNRHRLRNDGAVPRRAARVARTDGYRPRRRQGARLVNAVVQHLPVLPVVLPLVAGALLLLLPEARRPAPLPTALLSCCLQLVTAAALLFLTTDAAPGIWEEGIGVYSIGGWYAPFGIVLVVDRLSALMVALSATVGLSALVYS